MLPKLVKLERNRLNLDGVEYRDKHFHYVPFWIQRRLFVDSFNPTTKTQAALTSALQAASAAGNPEIRPAHLLLALLTQNDGIAAPLLEAVGVEPATIRAEAQRILDQLPHASGASSQPQLSRESLAAITTAQQLATEMDDEFVSTEHLMVGLATGDSDVAKLLTGHGASPQALRDAFVKVRGSARVTSADPEATYQALEKYSTDLTARAREGKPLGVEPVHQFVGPAGARVVRVEGVAQQPQRVAVL